MRHLLPHLTNVSHAMVPWIRPSKSDVPRIWSRLSPQIALLRPARTGVSGHFSKGSQPRNQQVKIIGFYGAPKQPSIEVFLEVYKTPKTNYYFFSNDSVILISPIQKGPKWHVAITATSAPHVQLVSLGKTWKFAFRLAPSSSNGKPEEI